MKTKIQWKKGTPPINGQYLVIFRYEYMEDIVFNDKGECVPKKYYATSVGISYWAEEIWSNYDSGDDSCQIIAWCHVKDILPTKNELFKFLNDERN